MSVDASAVASVLGIETQYEDLRAGAARFLPQVLVLVAQGQTGVTYSSERWQAPNLAAVGARFGYVSPAYLEARELMPVNGDGVATIPVLIVPLQDDAGGAAAVGNIAPSGSPTKATQYRVNVSGVKGKWFTLPAGAVNVSAASRKLRESVEGVLGMPVVATNTYGTVTSAPGAENAGDGTCTSLSVTGTPLPGDWTLTLITETTNGGTWKLQDPNGVLVSSALVMTAGAGQATVFDEGGIQFTITDNTNDFELGDTFTITVPATNTVYTSGWKGASANAITIEVEALESVGATFAITQPTGGLVDPAVDSALALIGNLWATMVLNQFESSNTTALDAFQTWGEGRWGELVHKPAIVFCGNTDAAVLDANVVTAVRKTDRINAQLVAPGSPNLPFVVAARQLARIAKVANNNPPVDYNGQKATGLTPGDDSVQWDYPTRDLANKSGCSTIEVVDGIIRIADVVTFYRPDGEEPPAFRDAVDIVKLQQVIYNLALEFDAPEWAAAPLIPDDEPTRNQAARKPKHAKAAIANIVDALADEAILVNRDEIKKSITAVISSSNPKRLDVGLTVQLSGNTKIKDLKLKFGFFFGQSALAA